MGWGDPGYWAVGGPSRTWGMFAVFAAVFPNLRTSDWPAPLLRPDFTSVEHH
jgi:hypothetical protein